MSACFSNCKVGPRAPGLEIGEEPGVYTRAQLLLAGALSPGARWRLWTVLSVCAPAPRRAQTLSLKVRKA